MKMGNIVSKVGIEPTSLAFHASVLTISPPRLPDVIMLHVYAALCLRGQSVQTTRLDTPEL